MPSKFNKTSLYRDIRLDESLLLLPDLDRATVRTVGENANMYYLRSSDAPPTLGSTKAGDTVLTWHEADWVSSTTGPKTFLFLFLLLSLSGLLVLVSRILSHGNI